MKKNKLWIVILVAILIVILIIGMVVLLTQKPDEVQNNEDDIQNVQTQNTEKLKQYIAKLGDNYYIKYSGKFKNNADEYIQSVVEYTKSGKDFGYRSSEINMNLLYKEGRFYTISHRYKLIVEIRYVKS